MRHLAAALMLLMSGTTGANARDTAVLSVADVIARHLELDGHLIRVRGWIGECHGRSCTLYETLGGAQGRGARAGWLSIGTAPDFDRRTGPLGLAQIEVRARLRAVCFSDPMPDGVVQVCADRVDQLQNARLVRVLSRATPD